jgi:hypothetical protein
MAMAKKKITRFSGPLNAKEFEALKAMLARAADPFREVEAICREELRKAGIPDDPTEGGKYPFRSCITEDLAKQEYRSTVWYSAAILDQLAARRWSLEVGDRGGAASADGRARFLYRERFIKSEYEPAVLAHKRVRAGQRKGGSRDKKIRPLVDWLLHTVKEYPEKPYTFYWNSIPEHDEGGRTKRINGVTMIREGGVLVVTGADGRKRFLAESSFKRYVADVKESLKK